MPEAPEMPDFLDQRTRAYLYRLLLALAAVAAVYGILDDQQLTAWLGFAAAILGNGLATSKTSTRRPSTSTSNRPRLPPIVPDLTDPPRDPFA